MGEMRAFPPGQARQPGLAGREGRSGAGPEGGRALGEPETGPGDG